MAYPKSSGGTTLLMDESMTSFNVDESLAQVVAACHETLHQFTDDATGGLILVNEMYVSQILRTSSGQAVITISGKRNSFTVTESYTVVSAAITQCNVGSGGSGTSIYTANDTISNRTAWIQDSLSFQGLLGTETIYIRGAEFWTTNDGGFNSINGISDPNLFAEGARMFVDNATTPYGWMSATAQGDTSMAYFNVFANNDIFGGQVFVEAYGDFIGNFAGDRISLTGWSGQVATTSPAVWVMSATGDPLHGSLLQLIGGRPNDTPVASALLQATKGPNQTVLATEYNNFRVYNQNTEGTNDPWGFLEVISGDTLTNATVALLDSTTVFTKTKVDINQDTLDALDVTTFLGFPGGADNLGNHTATQDLDLADFNLINADSIYASDAQLTLSTGPASNNTFQINHTTSTETQYWLKASSGNQARLYMGANDDPNETYLRKNGNILTIRAWSDIELRNNQGVVLRTRGGSGFVRVFIGDDYSGASNATLDVRGDGDTYIASLVGSSGTRHFAFRDDGTLAELGTMVFDTDQVLGAGQNGHVLTWNNTSGYFEAQAPAGGADSDWTVVADTLYNATGTLVGINTTSPTSALEVNGNIVTDDPDGPAFFDEVNSDTNPVIVPRRSSPSTGFGSGGDRISVITSGSQVGAFQSSRFDANHGDGFSIKGNQSSLTGATFIPNRSTSNGANNTGIGAGDRGDIAFYTGNSGEIVRFKDDGKVGIGTTSPDQTLHAVTPSVASSAETIAEFQIGDETNSTFIIGNASDTDAKFTPHFVGYQDEDQKTALHFRGLIKPADDISSSEEVLRFQAQRTDNASDPMAGTKTAVSVRDIFAWYNHSTRTSAQKYNGQWVWDVYPDSLFLGSGPDSITHVLGFNSAGNGEIMSIPVGSVGGGGGGSGEWTLSGSDLYPTTATQVGIGTTSPEAAFHVDDADYGVFRFERTVATDPNTLGVGDFKATSTVDVSDQFGPLVYFAIEDNTSGNQYIGAFGAERSNGQDNSGDMSFYTYNAGTRNEVIRMTYDEKVGIGVTSPDAFLELNKTYTTTGTSAEDRLSYFFGTVSSDNGVADRFPRAFYGRLDTDGATDFNGGSSSLVGVFGILNHVANIDIDEGIGLSGGFIVDNSATATNGYGLLGYYQNNDGGTVVNGAGLVGRYVRNGTGTMTNFNLIEGSYNLLTGSETITNYRGLYLPDPTQLTNTNEHQLYLLGDGVPSYIEGQLGIGTINPGVDLDIEMTSGNSIGARLIRTQASSTSGGAFLGLYSDDGAAMESGHRLGGFLLGGAEDASSTLFNGALIAAFTAEAYTASANGTYLTFETTPIGSDVRAEHARLTPEGYWSVGTTTAASPLHAELNNALNGSEQTVLTLDVDAGSPASGLGPKIDFDVEGETIAVISANRTSVDDRGELNFYVWSGFTGTSTKVINIDDGANGGLSFPQVGIGTDNQDSQLHVFEDVPNSLSTGTINATSGASTITGTGTTFTTEFEVGDVIAINLNESQIVSSITDNTNMAILGDHITTHTGETDFPKAFPIIKAESSGTTIVQIEASDLSRTALYGNANASRLGINSGLDVDELYGDDIEANDGVIMMETNHNLKFGTNALVRMTIEEDGEIGIGTINPGHALDVVGAIQASDSILVNGTKLTVPDYVFEDDFELPGIKEHAQEMYDKNHLPAAKSAEHIKEHGYNIAEEAMAHRKELELAHIYIDKLLTRLEALEVEVEKLKAQKD